jgi:hypothetical protein
MPGLPPKTAVIRQIIKAAYNPIIGETPAMMANATASGTKAKATVRPERRSSLVWIRLPNFRYINLNTVWMILGEKRGTKQSMNQEKKFPNFLNHSTPVHNEHKGWIID